MITKIKITLTDGSRYTLKSPDELEKVNPEKMCIFVFDNGEIYNGLTDGEVDEDDNFCVEKPGTVCSIGLPFGRLIGWAYKKQKL